MIASLASLGFAPSTALPTLTSTYCADVVETLTVEGSPPTPGKNYTLCVDNTKVRWNQVAADGSTMAIFNGTDFWQLTKNASAEGGWTCGTKTSGPESPSFMPYRMTTLDDGTTVNKTSETYDGVANAVDKASRPASAAMGDPETSWVRCKDECGFAHSPTLTKACEAAPSFLARIGGARGGAELSSR